MASARALRKRLAVVQFQARAFASSPVHALQLAAEHDLLLRQLDALHPPSRKRTRGSHGSDSDSELGPLVAAAYATASTDPAPALPAKRARRATSAEHPLLDAGKMDLLIVVDEDKLASMRHADLRFVEREVARDKTLNCPLPSASPEDVADIYSEMIKNEHKDRMQAVRDETLLREPREFERPCIEGDACMGRQVTSFPPLTLVEATTVEDELHFRATGAWKSPPGYCVLCKRVIAQWTHWNNEMGKLG